MVKKLLFLALLASLVFVANVTEGMVLRGSSSKGHLDSAKSLHKREGGGNGEGPKAFFLNSLRQPTSLCQFDSLSDKNFGRFTDDISKSTTELGLESMGYQTVTLQGVNYTDIAYNLKPSTLTLDQARDNFMWMCMMNNGHVLNHKGQSLSGTPPPQTGTGPKEIYKRLLKRDDSGSTSGNKKNLDIFFVDTNKKPSVICMIGLDSAPNYKRFTDAVTNSTTELGLHPLGKQQVLFLGTYYTSMAYDLKPSTLTLDQAENNFMWMCTMEKGLALKIAKPNSGTSLSVTKPETKEP